MHATKVSNPCTASQGAPSSHLPLDGRRAVPTFTRSEHIVGESASYIVVCFSTRFRSSSVI